MLFGLFTFGGGNAFEPFARRFIDLFHDAPDADLLTEFHQSIDAAQVTFAVATATCQIFRNGTPENFSSWRKEKPARSRAARSLGSCMRTTTIESADATAVAGMVGPSHRGLNAQGIERSAQAVRYLGCSTV